MAFDVLFGGLLFLRLIRYPTCGSVRNEITKWILFLLLAEIRRRILREKHHREHRQDDACIASSPHEWK